MRKGDPTANVRMDCLSKETMDEYFKLLKDTVVENDLLDSPNQIYNVDETGMPLDHRAPKIVAGRFICWLFFKCTTIVSFNSSKFNQFWGKRKRTRAGD